MVIRSLGVWQGPYDDFKGMGNVISLSLTSLNYWNIPLIVNRNIRDMDSGEVVICHKSLKVRVILNTRLVQCESGFYLAKA